MTHGGLVVIVIYFQLICREMGRYTQIKKGKKIKFHMRENMLAGQSSWKQISVSATAKLKLFATLSEPELLPAFNNGVSGDRAEISFIIFSSSSLSSLFSFSSQANVRRFPQPQSRRHRPWFRCRSPRCSNGSRNRRF